MSILIDSRFIVSIYALGQWFAVEKGTVCFDAYELIDYPHEWVDPGDRERESMARADLYLLGSYADKDFDGGCEMVGDRMTAIKMAGCSGIVFKEAETGLRVSFSIVELRAFKEDRP